MNHCPTSQIVLCQGNQCSMYCPNTSMVFKDAVQLFIGSSTGTASSTASSTSTTSAKGLETQQRTEGYCMDSEGNRSAC